MFVYKHADKSRPKARRFKNTKIDDIKTMPKNLDSLRMKSDKQIFVIYIARGWKRVLNFESEW